MMLQPSTDTLEAQQAYRSTLEKEIEQLEQRLAENSSPFRQETQAVTVNQVQSALPVDGALVEFVSYRRFDRKMLAATDRFAERRYVAFVLRRSGKPVWIELGDAAAIDASVNQLRSALKNSRSVDVRDLARALDQQVMQPIRRMSGAVRQIILSPDGGLNLLPFGVLVDEQNKYLIENYSITYLTSGRDLLSTPSNGYQKQNRPVVVANPLFDNTPTGGHASTARATSRSIDFTKFRYPPLPATALEAKEIATVLNGAEVLTEADATESAIKKVTQPIVLHLATHGFFLSDQKEPGADGRSLVRDRKSVEGLENPLLRSGLILAGVTQRSSGAGEDGVLSALEAAGLNLRGTELVVLSACETGIGEIKVGDGVLGLRRALVLAGARSQVTSLWQVDDEATRDLMVDFYTRLKQGEGKGEALRNAQLNMMRSAARAHPYFWASFIEIGDWRPLNRSALRDY
jgi:CHAT domain-containing protein